MYQFTPLVRRASYNATFVYHLLQKKLYIYKIVFRKSFLENTEKGSLYIFIY